MILQWQAMSENNADADGWWWSRSWWWIWYTKLVVNDDEKIRWIFPCACPFTHLNISLTSFTTYILLTKRQQACIYFIKAVLHPMPQLQIFASLHYLLLISDCNGAHHQIFSRSWEISRSCDQKLSNWHNFSWKVLCKINNLYVHSYCMFVNQVLVWNLKTMESSLARQNSNMHVNGCIYVCMHGEDSLCVSIGLGVVKNAARKHANFLSLLRVKVTQVLCWSFAFKG
jgi:hypothetical protein